MIHLIDLIGNTSNLESSNDSLGAVPNLAMQLSHKVEMKPFQLADFEFTARNASKKSKIVNFSTAQFSHKFVNTWVYAAFDRWTQVNVGPEYVWKGRIHENI